MRRLGTKGSDPQKGRLRKAGEMQSRFVLGYMVPLKAPTLQRNFQVFVQNTSTSWRKSRKFWLVGGRNRYR